MLRKNKPKQNLIKSLSNKAIEDKIKKDKKKLDRINRIKQSGNLNKLSLVMDTFDLKYVKRIALLRYNKKNKVDFFDKYVLRIINPKKYESLYGVKYGEKERIKFYKYIEFMHTVTDVAKLNRWLTTKEMIEHGVPMERLLSILKSLTTKYADTQIVNQKREHDIVSMRNKRL